MTTSHDATEDVVGRGPTAVIHDQTILFLESRLTAEVGLRDGLGVGVVFPFRVVDTGIRYLDAASGDEVQLTAPNIHHRNETLTGVGDPWLLGHLSFAWTKWTLDTRLGISVPLGRTEEDPFRLGDMGLPHEHFQFGTGTVNPIANVELGLNFDAWRLGAWLLTQQVFYENGKGYQAGDRYAGGVVASSPLGTGRWSFRTGIEAQAETAERWHGVTHADDGNQGRIDLLASAGAAWQANEWLALNASVRVPLYTHIVGGQLSYPLLATIGLSGSFALLGGGDHHEHEHEHEHDHGHEADAAVAADWTNVDKVEIASAGEAVPLTPVAAVVTVFDFWAPWCKPCKVLDVEMAALGRKYPGKIAIRKLNIVDWDSAAAAKYLVPGDFNLPHIKVFGPDGTLLFEQSSDPHVLSERVESLLK